VKLLDCLFADGKFNYTADLRSGMALGEWLGAQTFASVLDRCSERTVEVFWQTPLVRGRN
jgi:hypothetical protein